MRLAACCGARWNGGPRWRHCSPGLWWNPIIRRRRVRRRPMRTGLAESSVLIGMARLEDEGFALRGHFTDPGASEDEFCARGVLTRIHAYPRDRARREIEPVSAQDF